jgi:rod shape-determining protein MreD
MKTTFWSRLDALARQLVPFSLTMVMVLVMFLPVRVDGLQGVMPLLPLIALVFWSINRPDLMPAVAAFAIGLMQDVLSGAPLGVHAAAFTLLHSVIVGQRRFFLGKSFPIVWIVFAFIALGVCLATWLGAVLFHGRMINPGSSLVQALMTVAAFPPVCWFLIRCDSTVVRQA